MDEQSQFHHAATYAKSQGFMCYSKRGDPITKLRVSAGGRPKIVRIIPEDDTHSIELKIDRAIHDLG